MKKILSILMIAIMMVSALAVPVCADEDIILNRATILGAWYGQYTGHSNSVYVERYMNMTIEECDEKGNIKGTANVTTVEGQGYDEQWINYTFKGKIDFDTMDFYMKGTKILSANSSTSWSFAEFGGKVEGDVISGIVDNTKDKLFSFGRVSEWAKDEVTLANAYGLVPATMKNKDLSKPVTRAEFAAISLELYEALEGVEVPEATSNFTDIAYSPDKAAIEKAYFLNITVGIEDTIFGPENNITREQIATMLCRTIKKHKFDDWTFATDNEYYLDSEGVKKFADDADISDYARPSVYYMAKMGIVNGIGNNTFAPRNITSQQTAEGYANATREQAIALSYRIYNLSEMWK